MERNEVVLVVDDDQRVRQTFSRNLEIAGYRVLTAPGGKEALEIYERENLDIILVDVRMPYVDGFEVLEAIREQDTNIEIILVTGHGDMDTAIAALRAGASDFIPKPVEQRTLDISLQRARERQRLKRDLRTTQQELRASEEYYRGITETAFIGVGITSPDEDLTFVNQALAEMLRYTRDELIGMSLSQLTTPEEFERYKKRTDLVRAGMRDQYESILYRKDGEEVIVSISISPLRDDEGEFESTLAVVADITERKRAEEALAREAQVNAAMAELSQALISSVSLEDMSALVLEHAKELTQSTFGFVGYIDTQTSFLVSPTLTQGIWSECQVPDKTFIFEEFGGLWGWVLNHRTSMLTNAPGEDPRSTGVPEGHIPIERFLAAPALIDDQLVGQISVANATRDYTSQDLEVVERLASLYAVAIQRRQAEVALTASEERFRQLAENIREVFWLTNPAGDRILYVSPAYEEVWGTPLEELYTDSELWMRSVHPEDRDRVRRASEQQALGGYDQEYRIVRPDGTVRWIRARAFPVLDQRGEIYRIAGISEDITERKRTEEKLRQYAREQSMLYNVASAVSTQLNPDELLSTVLDVVLPAVDSTIGWVNVVQSSVDDPPHVVTWRGVPDDFVQAEEQYPLSQCAHCKALLAGETEISDALSLSECLRIPSEKLDWAAGYKHIGVPLVAGDEVLGILEIAWPEDHIHAADEKRLLVAIGRQVGLALHNAQLYQAARQVDRLRVLNELDRDLAATLDPEKVAETTLRQIARAIQAPLSMLFLLPTDDRSYPVRMFNLRQGWMETEATSEEQAYLKSIVERIHQTDGILLLPGSELSTAVERHRDVESQQWDENTVIPVWDQDDLAAILLLAGRSANRPFTDEDHALAKAAATRAGQAIRNARLYRASQRRGDRLATLNFISSAAVSSLEIEEVLQQVLELTCDALDTMEGSILLRDPETGELTFAVTLASKTSSLHGQRLARGQGVAGWVAEHGEAVCVNDVANDPRWYGGIDDRIQFKTRSLCCAPLRHLGEITGVIQIVNKRGGGFTDEDLNLLESVSAIAAVALQNARLYTATRERAEELALLNEIGMALTATLDRDIVVSAALAQIRLLFHAEGVALLQEHDEETLVFVRALNGEKLLNTTDVLRSKSCVSGQALNERQAVLEATRKSDHGPACLEYFLECEGRSLMAVPLLSAERTIGVIEVVSRKKVNYTPNDLQTLQAIGSTLTIALENAQLYEEVKELLREREQAQAQLIHAEKMTALGRLVASIAHEINNPLQSVQGCLTLVEEEMEADRRPDKMERYLNIATVEIDRISTIVRRMRDFYRSPREGMRPIAIHSVLESVLALTGKQLQHNYVEVERHWTEPLPSVVANPDHLKQVFLNLVLNASDAMPEGGTLQIVTALDQMVSTEEEQTIPAIRIDFTDDGIGMSEETQARLFEPFFTTKEHGSGLGLSITYSIIQSHDGKISATSQEGVGTTFTILLPAQNL